MRQLLGRISARHKLQTRLGLTFGGLALALAVVLSVFVRETVEALTGAPDRFAAATTLQVQIVLFGLGAASAFMALGWVLAGQIAGQQQVHQQQRLERMRDNFIATVSHELRTPLTSINGSLALLTTGLLERQPDRANRMLRIAATNADRLARLVNDVLDVERLESGRATFDMRECAPAALVTGATECLREEAARRRIELVVEAPVDPAMQLRADPERIQRVVHNLLDNALKFSPADTRVVVRVEASDQDVRVSVRDQGQGIPAEKLGPIFERFQQADMSDARRASGTGLGLTICKSIVQAHGGVIVAESPGEGAGSTFSFVIPR